MRDPDVDHVIWTSVSVRAVNPGNGSKSFYFGAYACCWEGPSNRNGLAAAFQGIAKTNIYAEYSVSILLHVHPPKNSVCLSSNL